MFYGAAGDTNAQDAHEGIRPTDPARSPDSVQKYLSPEQFKLYQLIWQRFMASQMAPAVFDTTTVDFNIQTAAHQYLFRATGSVIKFNGFLVLYKETREEGDSKALEDEQALPSIEAGAKVPVKEIKPTQHFTEPPPRFSEASLVKELERLGIGRPSTYASIISTLTERHYAELEQRRFFPTSLGESVEKVMVKQFPDEFNVGFTASMERELDKVEEGDLPWQRVLKVFYGPFEKALGAVDYEALIHEAHDLTALENEKCPLCGGKLVAKGGFFGPFIACENHPKTCKYTRPVKGERVPPVLTNVPVPCVRQDDGRAARPVGRVPRLQRISQVPRYALDAHRREVSEGRRRHRRAPLEEARQGVLRLRELSEVRFRLLGQAGGGDLPGMRLRRRGSEVVKDARVVSQVPQVRERVVGC